MFYNIAVMQDAQHATNQTSRQYIQALVICFLLLM
jgi:hypothetical protein